MNWLRHILLELWAITVLAVVVGFLGPFGTYVGTSLGERVREWAALLLGAYVLVRPWIWGLRRIADWTSLPAGPLTLWGVVATSLPLAMIWRVVGQDAYRALDGYAELLPFALLSALAVFGVAQWADAADRRLAVRKLDTQTGAPTGAEPAPSDACGLDASTHRQSSGPRLLARLGPGFRAPIAALQSEDHYVRVHGVAGSELILMRLRDAIEEMAGIPGEQVHRSWWVARDEIASVSRSGRAWVIHLANGEVAPVARESIERLRRTGFLGERKVHT